MKCIYCKHLKDSSEIFGLMPDQRDFCIEKGIIVSDPFKQCNCNMAKKYWWMFWVG